MTKAIVVPFVRVHKDARDPQRMSEQAAGWDVVATEVTVDLDHGVLIYSTGLSVALQPGTFLDLRPRSSIYKTPWMLANGCGVIDADYRGEVKVIFRPLEPGLNIRDSDHWPYQIGEGIAQFILARHETAQYEEHKELPKTDRGEGGFGSTTEAEEPPKPAKKETKRGKK